jgi:hypothetical protein
MTLQDWEDRLELCALEAAYGPRWDLGDGAGWSELFTPDGIFEVAPVEGRPAIRYEGRRALAERCIAFNEQSQGVHHLGAPDLSVAGDAASSVVPFSFTGVNMSAGRTWEVVGLYKVRYARTSEGWRIQHRLEAVPMRSTREGYLDAFRDVRDG